jgi:hypothetical protein
MLAATNAFRFRDLVRLTIVIALAVIAVMPGCGDQSRTSGDMGEDGKKPRALADVILVEEMKSEIEDPTSRYIVEEMKADLKASYGTSYSVRGFELIAWAVKGHFWTAIPNLLEECIAVVPFGTDYAGTQVWTLVHLMRTANSTSPLWRQWREVRYQKSSAPPTEEEIADFIGKTSFGNKTLTLEEYGTIRVFSVVAYRDSKAIISALQEGLSAEEKARRLEEFEEEFEKDFLIIED